MPDHESEISDCFKTIANNNFRKHNAIIVKFRDEKAEANSRFVTEYITNSIALLSVNVTGSRTTLITSSVQNSL